ncbi:MAG: hypothetical protein O9297_03110 [Flavobacterium sp.]|uniref:hypothetical protein n=1 Tax=Flavobacterium sp. TaxID=239 RepID=UPI0022BD34CE|nr:hypothetical protein [Flavobacterium sp.]MCZ8296192.1 hypothetical protein [Flavobacterium sp.]
MTHQIFLNVMIKRVLICDKNKALGNYLKERLEQTYDVEIESRKIFKVDGEPCIAIILVIYENIDLLSLIPIFRKQKNVIIGTSSREIIEYIHFLDDDIYFFDFRETKKEIYKKLENLLFLFMD